MKNYSNAQNVLAKISTKLSDFTKNVLIIHQDGSCMLFTHAFMFRYGLWLLVFTEHQRNHIFHINDLHRYLQFGSYEKLDQVDDNGDLVKEIVCSKCFNTVPVNQSHSVYDEFGNRTEAELCMDCDCIENE